MLPEQLQQMDANADQMIKALSEPAQAESVADNQAEAEHSSDAGQTDAGVAASEAQPAPTSDVSADIKALKQEVFNANQRWSTLQGMLDKKDTELEAMRTLLAQLNSRQEVTPPQTAPTKHLREEDSEQFGEELIAAVQRAARDEAEDIAARLVEQHIKPLIDRLNGVQQVATGVAGSSFEDRLASRVPDWREVNVDQGFMAWLNELAPYSRETKLSLLQGAYKAMDLEATARFFTDYKATLAPQQAEAPQAAAPSPATFSAPGRPKAAPPTHGTPTNVWTPTDISKLYKDFERKAISEAEFVARERDLFKAQEEGRIAY